MAWTLLLYHIIGCGRDRLYGVRWSLGSCFNRYDPNGSSSLRAFSGPTFCFRPCGWLGSRLANLKRKWAPQPLFPSKEALGNYFYNWWDYALLLIFGGIPWHVYFQRVLSSKDENTAQRLSIIAGFVCIFAAIPASMIGIIGNVVDWTTVGLSQAPEAAQVLPNVVRYLANPWVATVA